ncbi:DNA repair protein RecO [Maribacter sp. 2307ULW6-5]|uniref:DNA repair protein RecO n=1 Tax=Maribacter sp. 2307ULW6-5 TaxID=3386275 RepID=UPI0039BCB84F
MQVTTKAIVFSALKYGDTSLVVKAFTATHGVMSYLLQGVLTAKKGKVKPAYFQPLAQLELVANHRNNANLQRIREARVHYHYQTLHTDMAKNALTLFLAEMLRNSIHEEEANPALFQYLETALQWFDGESKTANFHIAFLLTLTKYLGFYPDAKNREWAYFDLLEGGFVASPTLNPLLQGQVLQHFKRFLGTPFEALDSIKMNRTERQELLLQMINYFELHLQGFKKPRSLGVLHDVFH